MFDFSINIELQVLAQIIIHGIRSTNEIVRYAFIPQILRNTMQQDFI